MTSMPTAPIYREPNLLISGPFHSGAECFRLEAGRADGPMQTGSNLGQSPNSPMTPRRVCSLRTHSMALTCAKHRPAYIAHPAESFGPWTSLPAKSAGPLPSQDMLRSSRPTASW